MIKSFKRRIFVTYISLSVFCLIGIFILGLAGFLIWLAYFALISISTSILVSWLFLILISMIGAMGIFVVIWSGRFIFSLRFWRQRDKKRQEAAEGNRPDLLATEQPNENDADISLPLKIEMQMRPSLRKRLQALYGILIAGSLALVVIPVICQGWQTLFRSDSIRALGFIFLILALVGTIRQKRYWIIDATGIKMGVKGSYSTSIPWQNVRLIALYGNKGQPLESFEVASASSSIIFIWQRNESPKVWFRNLTSVSAPDTHNQQIDAILAYALNRTGLPLYDLRDD